MDKAFLEDCLAKGLSLEKIGRLTDRDPSTVSYWLKKHGLEAVGRARHAPKRSIDPEIVRQMIERGATIREVCGELGAGYSSVRYWVKKLGLETEHMDRVRETREALASGARKVRLHCPKHGRTTFYRRPDQGFRCSRCNSEAVAARRRKVKAILVEEAGGSCVICGYSRYPGALHFHHLEPNDKVFALSRQGVTRSLDKARLEAGKCVLLCANCHSEVEGGFAKVPTNRSLEFEAPG